MASNFDITFEKNKGAFAQKFGVQWNANPQLYLAYLQTLYTASLTEIANNGLGQISAQQKDTNELLRSVSKKLEK